MPHRLTTVLGLTVAALVLTSGGAVAARLITGAQIQNGTITSVDVRDRSLVSRDLSAPTVRSFSRPGPAGPRGAPGLARGWGRVAPDGTVSQGSPGVTVTRPETGIYCITVPGVARTSSVVVATPDYETNSTGTGLNNTQSFVEFGGGDVVCPATALSVRTFTRSFNSSSGDLLSTTLTLQDDGFTFLVP